MKYYRMGYVEVTRRRSYLNILLLNAAIPGTKPVAGKDDEADKVPDKEIHANDFFSQFM